MKVIDFKILFFSFLGFHVISHSVEVGVGVR